MSEKQPHDEIKSSFTDLLMDDSSTIWPLPFYPLQNTAFSQMCIRLCSSWREQRGREERGRKKIRSSLAPEENIGRKAEAELVVHPRAKKSVPSKSEWRRRKSGPPKQIYQTYPLPAQASRLSTLSSPTTIPTRAPSST
ncbi:uncharacterized protein LOC144548453 isoform X2 [Carex rostrata]